MIIKRLTYFAIIIISLNLRAQDIVNGDFNCVKNVFHLDSYNSNASIIDTTQIPCELMHTLGVGLANPEACFEGNCISFMPIDFSIGYFDYQYLGLSLSEPLKNGVKYNITLNIIKQSYSDSLFPTVPELTFIMLTDSLTNKSERIIREDEIESIWKNSGSKATINISKLEKGEWLQLEVNLLAMGGERFIFLGVNPDYKYDRFITDIKILKKEVCKYNNTRNENKSKRIIQSLRDYFYLWNVDQLSDQKLLNMINNLENPIFGNPYYLIDNISIKAINTN